ncbi:uncharacterized protein LOC135586506 [Musa acuminata AAA Group]|uniref:uncharacterized protein LOC135586506 n=1 Tax=Musa acuminata AAA Group TaxID=214697 RepID=UPI0031DB641E
MDSGNRGSLQSNSGGGGDDDFDSHVDSLSAFFSSSSVAGATTLPPAPLSDGQHFFDYPSISYLNSSTSLLPLDSAAAVPWLCSHLDSSNCTAAAVCQSSSSMSSVQQPVPTAAAAAGSRSSKKRSRASRRAPTTVLTTDTSNFRAMVQEFTGIPSPPFAAASSSPFARSRFDLFHSASVGFRCPTDAPPPPFLLRPFPQKVQSPSLPTTTNSISSFSSSPPALIPTTTAYSVNTCTPTDNHNSDYQLPYQDLGLGGGHSQSPPALNFQSPLQPSLLQANYTHAMPTSFDAKPYGVPSAEYGNNVLSGLLPGHIASKAMRSGWPDASTDLAQSRPLSGRLELDGERQPESIAATRSEGMAESRREM